MSTLSVFLCCYFYVYDSAPVVFPGVKGPYLVSYMLAETLDKTAGIVIG